MKINKDAIIEKTMILIYQKNGSLNITVRDIAKSLGCSHPNIYNYYNDLNELLWDCLTYALNEMMNYVIPFLNLSNEPKEKFKIFFDSLLNFALDHISWYKLIWYDPMNSEIPEKVKPLLSKPGIYLNNLMLEMFPELLTIESASQISRILHRYIHGELSTVIAARVILENKEEFINSVLDNCLLMINMRLNYQNNL